jgi:hypothetical protein
LDQFSPRQSRPHFKIASIAAAGASQSKDRNDKQKTGFFDSIDHFQTFGTALGRGLAVSHAMESHHPRRIPKRKTAKIDDHHGVIEWSV